MEQIIHSIEHISAFDVVGLQDTFPIVLVHGVSWTRKMWMLQLETLSDEFRVIALIYLDMEHYISNNFS